MKKSVRVSLMAVLFAVDILLLSFLAVRIGVHYSSPQRYQAHLRAVPGWRLAGETVFDENGNAAQRAHYLPVNKDLSLRTLYVESCGESGEWYTSTFTETDEEHRPLSTTRYSEDGDISERTVYDYSDDKSAATVTTESFKDGTTSRKYEEYDENGNAVRTYDVGENGEKTLLFSAEYDDMGRTVKTWTASGELGSSHSYNSAGNKTEWISGAKRTVYKYDSWQNKTTQISYDENGKTAEMVYKYDILGRLRRITTYDRQGEMTGCTTYEYGKRTVTETAHIADGTVNQTTVKTLDRHGNHLTSEITHFTGGQATMRQYVEYVYERIS